MKRFLQFFHNLHFQHKLLLSYLAVVLIPLLMWNIYSYRQTNASLRAQAEVNFLDMGSNALQNLSNKLHRIETAFSIVTGDTSIGQILTTEYASDYQKYVDVTQRFDPNINTLLMLNPEIVSLDIYTGGSIRSARENFHDLDEAWTKAAWASLANSAEAKWFTEGGRLYLVRQVLDLNHLDRAALVALELDYESMFSGISADANSYGLLIEDGEGRVLYRNAQLISDFGADAVDAAELQRICAERAGLLCQSRSISPTGWTLFMYLDASGARMPPQVAFRSMFLMLAFSLLLLFLVIPLFSHTMVKRIETLNAYLSRVVKDGFREDIASPDRDEIGLITNSVGLMVKETRTLIDEVYESRLRQREAEIKALQSQINPHFLYNTLSAINWQAIKTGNSEVSQIATALSTFYRSTLNLGSSISTVEQELETTKAYLDIQLCIHENSFDVLYEVSPNVLEYNMPHIILQPIVENAIEHGVDMKEDKDRGIIEIRIWEEDDDIVLQVSDNGPGIRPEALSDIFQNDKKGYGVKNVNERLNLFFGARYGLSFRPTERSGTCAVIRIPKYVELGPDLGLPPSLAGIWL